MQKRQFLSVSVAVMMGVSLAHAQETSSQEASPQEAPSQEIQSQQAEENNQRGLERTWYQNAYTLLMKDFTSEQAPLLRYILDTSADFNQIYAAIRIIGELGLSEMRPQIHKWIENTMPTSHHEPFGPLPNARMREEIFLASIWTLSRFPTDADLPLLYRVYRAATTDPVAKAIFMALQEINPNPRLGRYLLDIGESLLYEEVPILLKQGTVIALALAIQQQGYQEGAKVVQRLAANPVYPYYTRMYLGEIAAELATSTVSLVAAEKERAEAEAQDVAEEQAAQSAANPPAEQPAEQTAPANTEPQPVNNAAQ